MRDNKGRFVRTIQPWTLAQWDNGYLDNKDRFRVYRPDYPRCYKGGFALRAHVVWWLAKGVPHPLGTELHHRDHTRNNDQFENLELLTKSEHRKHHQSTDCHFNCIHCGGDFFIPQYRVREGKGRFCSRRCYLDSAFFQEHLRRAREEKARLHVGNPPS